MTRFKAFFNEQIDATTSVVVHHVEGDASVPRVRSQVKAAVVDARLLLNNTLAALASGRPDDNSKIIKYANRYFRTADSWVDAQDTQKIHDKILLISNGLNADIDLKIHRIVPEKGVQEVGFVNSWAEVHHPKKRHDEVHRREVPTKDDPNKYIAGNFLYGKIHITPEQVSSGRSGVRTLIHEASHRYTGTEDHCYCNADGTGFLQEPQKFRKGIPIKDQLLNNADSYAWFILKVGRGGDGFTNKMTK